MKRTAQQNIALAFGIIITIVCVAVLAATFRSGPKISFPTATPPEEAWHFCIQRISQKIGVHASDAPPYAPDSVIKTAENQYRVDIFFATQGQVYRCELLQYSNGDMELLKLEKTNSYP